MICSSINLKIHQGELVAFVGTVGSGKSSILAAILGEMTKVDGQVTVNGSIAYVPQTAWVMNATLKQNILFGKEFDQKLYDEVIAACALRSDFGRTSEYHSLFHWKHLLPGRYSPRTRRNRNRRKGLLNFFTKRCTEWVLCRASIFLVDNDNASLLLEHCTAKPISIFSMIRCPQSTHTSERISSGMRSDQKVYWRVK